MGLREFNSMELDLLFRLGFRARCSTAELAGALADMEALAAGGSCQLGGSGQLALLQPTLLQPVGCSVSPAEGLAPAASERVPAVSVELSAGSADMSADTTVFHISDTSACQVSNMVVDTTVGVSVAARLAATFPTACSSQSQQMERQDGEVEDEELRACAASAAPLPWAAAAAAAAKAAAEAAAEEAAERTAPPRRSKKRCSTEVAVHSLPHSMQAREQLGCPATDAAC